MKMQSENIKYIIKENKKSKQIFHWDPTCWKFYHLTHRGKDFSLFQMLVLFRVIMLLWGSIPPCDPFAYSFKERCWRNYSLANCDMNNSDPNFLHQTCGLRACWTITPISPSQHIQGSGVMWFVVQHAESYPVGKTCPGLMCWSELDNPLAFPYPECCDTDLSYNSNNNNNNKINF